MIKVKLKFEAFEETIIDLPDDWDDLSDSEKKEWLSDEKDSFCRGCIEQRCFESSADINDY